MKGIEGGRWRIILRCTRVLYWEVGVGAGRLNVVGG
jgi:hypothetical protein